MKKSQNKWLLTLTSLGLSSLVMSSCTEAELDHPFNPNSPDFIGEEYAKDSDGDGLADIYAVYEDECGVDLDCVIKEAVADGIIEEPSSSVKANSSSSFVPLEGVDLFVVKIENGFLKGTEISGGEYPANARLEIESSGASTLGKCFDGWVTTDGNVSDAQSADIIYRVPIEPKSDTIVITGSLVDCDIGDAFQDARDGQVYDYVEIGGEIWMASNLNYAASTSYCNEVSDPDCSLYGRFYDWGTATAGSNTTGGSVVGVQGICPAGWHLPSKADLDKLTSAITLPQGGYGTNEGSPKFFVGSDTGYKWARFWTSQVGAATTDTGTPRNFCNLAAGQCATGFAFNPENNAEDGWRIYAAEEKKTNLFNVRCLKD